MAAVERFDLIVIGAGPGGYVASLRAAELGLKTACVEKAGRVGGVCLNVGCIPSKALLDSSEYYFLARSGLGGHGVLVKDLALDLPAMMARKDRVVQGLVENVRKLMEGNGIRIIHGTALLSGENRVEISGNGESAGSVPAVCEAGSILLATGSEPISVPSLPFDGKRIVSSTEALAFDSVPGHLVVAGGGYIGLELGSVWNRLGSNVTVIEMTPGVATVLDGQVSRALARYLTRQGFSFRLRTRVTNAKVTAETIRLKLEAEGKEEEIECDRLLVAVGRRPLTRGLGIAENGIATDPATGHVLVDEKYRTSNPAVYAIGDLIPGPMLAHKAMAEGIAAVECMAGLPGEVNYDAIPSAVYTSPEVASVGLTEEKARERGIGFVAGSYPFAGSGRARCMGESEGFVKIVAHARSGRILGVHIIGPRASELIAECALAMEFNAGIEDLIRAVHAHPTLSEAIREAALNLRAGKGGL